LEVFIDIYIPPMEIQQNNMYLAFTRTRQKKMNVLNKGTITTEISDL